MERITVARIGKTHGVKGYVKVNSFSGSYDHFGDIEEGTLVFRHGKEISVRIEEVVPFGDRVLLKFVGYDSPEAARTLTGGELWVDKKHAAPLGKDEYYIADLKGCSVFFWRSGLRYGYRCSRNRSGRPVGDQNPGPGIPLSAPQGRVRRRGGYKGRPD